MNIQSDDHDYPSSSQIANRAILFVFFLYIAWIGAWLLEQTLAHYVEYLSTDQGQFVYFLTMKLLLWVVPSILIIRYSGHRFIDVMGRHRLRSMVLWGGGVGLALGAITIGIKALGNQPIFAFGTALSLISGVLVAPIVEEIAFRGAILGSLTQRYRFWFANLLTAFFFLGVHFPGWYFQGTLMANVSSPLNGALSIFILGLVFGYVAHRSKSVSGSIITHILNNAFNA
jgi:membrane protease YdiL (CAAX protease family)